MGVAEQPKQIALKGRNERDLGQRIELLREAIATRGGAIVDVELSVQPKSAAFHALVAYRVPPLGAVAAST